MTMAERIAIMGGEQYAEWIKRDGQAQRLFKAYRSQWPEGDTQCAAISDEFYVRFDNGDGMRRVCYAGDFDDEDEWCAQCGTPIDPDSGNYYCCDAFGCDAVLCDNCGGSLTCDGYYCPRHRGSETLADGKEPSYVYPYAFGDGNQFTYGVEIELESDLPDGFVETVTDSDIIAGWDKDASLENGNGIELQSNILDMSKLPALKHIVESIPEYGENAGGHIHVARTDNQCASRWYWALRGLKACQCRLLNMRHIDATIGARSNMASTPASTPRSTTSMRTLSNCARSAAGMRAAPTSLSQRSSGRAPCGASSKSTPAARLARVPSNSTLHAWPTT